MCLWFQVSGHWGTVPELLFEKKGLIPALQQLLTSQLGFDNPVEVCYVEA